MLRLTRQQIFASCCKKSGRWPPPACARRLGEVVCAPGVEDASLLDAVSRADLAAFAAQSPQLAKRYRA